MDDFSTSSYFLSASSAKKRASFSWFSRASMRSSSANERFSKTLRALQTSNAKITKEAKFSQCCCSFLKSEILVDVHLYLGTCEIKGMARMALTSLQLSGERS